MYRSRNYRLTKTSRHLQYFIYEFSKRQTEQKSRDTPTLKRRDLNMKRVEKGPALPGMVISGDVVT